MILPYYNRMVIIWEVNMKRFVCGVSALLLLFLLLVGCASTHTHNFIAATCTTPRTCTTCGQAEGHKLEHNYQNGFCSYCLKTDPDYKTVEEMVWIPRTGKRYHTNADCSNMSDPFHVSISTAISWGFTPCQKCYRQ